MTPDPPVQRGPRTEVGVQVLNFFHKMRQTGELPDKTKWKKMVESVDRIDEGLRRLDNIQCEVDRLSFIVEGMGRQLIQLVNQVAYLMDRVA